MKVEVKNWLGIVILLCLGFILGRTSILTDVNASQQELKVGRYQLVLGDIDLPHFFFNEEGFPDTTWQLRSSSTLFRIVTKTGDVERYSEERITLKDTHSIWEHRWDKITGVEVMKDK